MCGRYSITQIEEQKLKERFCFKKIPANLKPRYNVAPSQDVPVILNESPEELTFVRWGLIPHWAKEENTQYSMINAKAETITEKPAYRGPIKKRRCLIIADSFFEWKKTNGKKQPFRIMLKDESLFTFAGIWDCWEKDGEVIQSCSIITTSPNELTKSIHDRMPVILPRDEEKKWLSDIDLGEAVALLRPYDAKTMEAYEISTLVNSPSNDILGVIKSVASVF